MFLEKNDEWIPGDGLYDSQLIENGLVREVDPEWLKRQSLKMKRKNNAGELSMLGKAGEILVGAF